MNVLIQRGSESNVGTFGKLQCGDFKCFTLELPDRDNRSNVSRIPNGDYEIKLVTTGRQFSGRDKSYWLKSVDGRSGILLHSGTWAGDKSLGKKTHSWGCILLGYTIALVGGQPGLLRSRPCVWEFMDNVLQGSDAQLRIG